MPDRVRAIVNQALLRIAEQSVDDLETTEQESALTALEMLPVVMDEATSEWEWSFATEQTVLTVTDGVVAAPADLIRVLSVGPDSAEWRLIGREIHTNVDELTVTYVKSLVTYDEVTDQPIVDAWILPKFQIAVACRLASELAAKFAGNMQLSGMLQQEYMVLIRQARSQDSLGSEGPDEEPEDWRTVY